MHVKNSDGPACDICWMAYGYVAQEKGHLYAVTSRRIEAEKSRIYYLGVHMPRYLQMMLIDFHLFKEMPEVRYL